MAQTSTVSLTYGDSLRALADVVDQVPSLIMAKDFPEGADALIVIAKSRSAVEGLAAALDVPAESYKFGSHLHTVFEIARGHVTLRVAAVEPIVRELHRDPSSVPVHDLMEP